MASDVSSQATSDPNKVSNGISDADLICCCSYCENRIVSSSELFICQLVDKSYHVQFKTPVTSNDPDASDNFFVVKKNVTAVSWWKPFTLYCRACTKEVGYIFLNDKGTRRYCLNSKDIAFMHSVTNEKFKTKLWKEHWLKRHLITDKERLPKRSTNASNRPHDSTGVPASGNSSMLATSAAFNYNNSNNTSGYGHNGLISDPYGSNSSYNRNFSSFGYNNKGKPTNKYSGHGSRYWRVPAQAPMYTTPPSSPSKALSTLTISESNGTTFYSTPETTPQRQTQSSETWTSSSPQSQPLQPPCVTLSYTRVCIIDTCEKFALMQQDLESTGCTAIGIDCEGIQLSRTGKLCLIQIHNAKSNTTYLVDTLSEASNEIMQNHLKPLLESTALIKVMHDCRQDSDALWHQFNIKLTQVFDIQIGHVVIKQQKWETSPRFNASKAFREYPLPVGFTKLLQIYCGIEFDEKEDTRKAMNEDPQFWTIRPLTDEMKTYAVKDVSYLPYIYERMQDLLILEYRIIAFQRSEQRLSEFRDNPRGDKDWLEHYERLKETIKNAEQGQSHSPRSHSPTSSQSSSAASSPASSPYHSYRQYNDNNPSPSASPPLPPLSMSQPHTVMVGHGAGYHGGSDYSGSGSSSYHHHHHHQQQQQATADQYYYGNKYYGSGNGYYPQRYGNQQHYYNNANPSNVGQYYPSHRQQYHYSANQYNVVSNPPNTYYQQQPHHHNHHHHHHHNHNHHHHPHTHHHGYRVHHYQHNYSQPHSSHQSHHQSLAEPVDSTARTKQTTQWPDLTMSPAIHTTTTTTTVVANASANNDANATQQLQGTPPVAKADWASIVQHGVKGGDKQPQAVDGASTGSKKTPSTNQRDGSSRGEQQKPVQKNSSAPSSSSSTGVQQQTPNKPNSQKKTKK